MKVAVNALYLRPGLVGGSEVYVREVVGRLKANGASRVVVYCWEGATEYLNDHHQYEVRPVFGGEYSQAKRLSHEWSKLPNLLEAERPDVVFSPGNFAIPTLRRIPQVATIHDLQHRWLPECFRRSTRVYRDAMFGMTCTVARRLIAVSRFTADDVAARYGVDPSKVEALPLGVVTFRPGAAQIEQALRDLGVTRPYVYYPAALWPHKNHDVAVDAVRIARERLSCDLRLVLSGNAGRWNEARSWPTFVTHVGYVPHEQVGALMSAATALLFCSRFEGFGLPLVEAMQLGTPVIASRAASIPELVGDAGLLREVDDIQGWADAIVSILSSKDLRHQLSDRGLRQAAHFSWDRCAARTVEVLETACRG